MRPGLDDSTRMRSAHQHRLLDVVRHHQDRLDRHAPLVPEVEQVGAQGLGGQHVEGRERLVHQQDLGLHDEGAGKADALAHAAGKLLGIGGFEAVEADGVDRLQRSLGASPRAARRWPAGRSRRCRARRARGTARSSGTPSPRPWPDRSPARRRSSLCRRTERSSPDDDPQERRLAAARRPSRATISPVLRLMETSSSTSLRVSPEPVVKIWLTLSTLSSVEAAVSNIGKLLIEGAYCVRGAGAAPRRRRAGARTGGSPA